MSELAKFLVKISQFLTMSKTKIRS